MQVAIATENPVKINAVKTAFLQVFPNQNIIFSAKSVPSGVGSQPVSDQETLTGAINRIENLKPFFPDTDYRVSLEGGVEKNGEEVSSFAWAVVGSGQIIGKSRTASFYLPVEVVALLDQGHELGTAMDIIHSKTNTKQNEGAVGILSHNVINREQLYTPAVILALIQFVNPNLQFK
jgi:inosine/xanthosine triphosphatase